MSTIETPSARFFMVAAVLALAATWACGGPRYATRGSGAAPVKVTASAHVLGIVRIPAPWYALRFVIAGRFRSAVPEYEAIAGLQKKYFTLTDDRQFGGIYEWATRADAGAFYTDAWRRAIRDRRGEDPDVLLLDAPYEVEGSTRIEGDAVGRRAIAYPATATLVLWDAGDEASALARRLAAPELDAPGMVRAFVVTAPRRAGVVALWASRELAEQGLAEERLRSLGGKAPSVTIYFDAPVLIDDALRSTKLP